MHDRTMNALYVASETMKNEHAADLIRSIPEMIRIVMALESCCGDETVSRIEIDGRGILEWANDIYNIAFPREEC